MAINRDKIRALNIIQSAEGADLRNIKDADVFSILNEDKINDFVYWRDDSHWNKIGIKLAMEYVSTKITNNSN